MAPRRPEQDANAEVYDDFDGPGYSLTDYAKRWITPYGLGEMAVSDTRNFSGGCLNVAAVPFQTASDVGVNDHLKYMSVSSRTFPVPEDGTLVLSSDIKASTPGTVPDLIQLGVHGPTGSWADPAHPPRPPDYRAPLMQGQQAAVVMNALDFCTGQLFDWFIASDAAFALIERLPTAVTGNVGNPDGAFQPVPSAVVLVASAASPAVAALLQRTFASVASRSGRALAVHDLVPLPSSDSSGATTFSLILSLIIAGLAGTTLIYTLTRHRPEVVR